MEAALLRDQNRGRATRKHMLYSWGQWCEAVTLGTSFQHSVPQVPLLWDGDANACSSILRFSQFKYSLEQGLRLPGCCSSHDILETSLLSLWQVLYTKCDSFIRRCFSSPPLETGPLGSQEMELYGVKRKQAWGGAVWWQGVCICIKRAFGFQSGTLLPTEQGLVLSIHLVQWKISLRCSVSASRGGLEKGLVKMAYQVQNSFGWQGPGTHISLSEYPNYWTMGPSPLTSNACHSWLLIQPQFQDLVHLVHVPEQS